MIFEVIILFKEITTAELNENFFKSFGDEWFLITAGDKDNFNTMTAGWGFAGKMWGEDAIGIVIRPQRYTMKFVEESDKFSISFYGDNKEIHKVCGSKSGRDCDKVKECGLTPVFDNDSIYFEQARLVIVCKKQYVQKMQEECFCDKTPDERWYPQKDYHYLIIGKVEKVLVK